MRLFIAFDAEKISEELKKVQENLLEKFEKQLKPVHSFHLTFKFLGEVDEKEIPRIKDALSAIKFNKIKTKLSGLGYFPSKDYIKVVWAGLKPDNEIIQLQKQIDNATNFIETKKTNQFHSHLTIARVRFLKPDEKKAFVELVKTQKIQELEFEIANFKLIKSELTPEGPIYEDLAEFPLS